MVEVLYQSVCFLCWARVLLREHCWGVSVGFVGGCSIVVYAVGCVYGVDFWLWGFDRCRLVLTG